MARRSAEARRADKLNYYSYTLGFDMTEYCGAGTFRIACSQCDAAVINGIPTHEHGCPRRPVECPECGTVQSREDAARCCAPIGDGEE